MSYYKQISVLLHSNSKAEIKNAKMRADQIFGGLHVSEIVMGMHDGYFSFFIPAPGTSTGSEIYQEWEDKREKFLSWVHNQRNKDGENPLTYVVIAYDEEIEETHMRVKIEDNN